MWDQDLMQHIISLIILFTVFFRSPMQAHQQWLVIEECIVITTGPSPQMSCYHHCSQQQ